MPGIHEPISMLCAIAALISSACLAETPRPTIFDLPLGAMAEALPSSAEFGTFACGNNGGPPGKVLTGWRDFKTCVADLQGRHEVYFEYDDEAEYVARAHEDYPKGWDAGTAIDAFPVMTSVLFDDAGRVVGLRMVTDPRPEQRDDPFLHVRPRQEHYLLGLYLLDRFGVSPSDCHDEAAKPGESAVLGMFVRQRCAATIGEKSYMIESQLYRRPGESDVDLATGLRTEGAFVSETRAEILVIPAASTSTPPHPAPARP
jgi:hypothetical protein